MATPNPLATLLRLQSPSNMNSTGDSYLDRRRSDIVSGMDEFAPSELEQLTTQNQLGDSGLGVSRDLIRQHGIQKGIEGARAQQEKLRQLLLPAQIKGQYDVAAAEAQGKAAGDRLRYSQNEQNARQAAQIAAMGGRQETGIDAATEAAKLKAAADAAKQQATIAARPIPAGIQKGVDTARGRYEGMGNNPLSRMIFGNEREAGYTTALEQALSTHPEDFQALQGDFATLQSIPGATLAERIAATGAQDTLNPYERAWLQLKLGVK